MKWVVLWTDVLIFILLASIIVFALYVRGQKQLHEQWSQVIRRRLGSISLIIIMAYVCVGLLDSFHYREALPGSGDNGEVHYSGEVMSALDFLMTPIRTTTEKSYSAPFATHLHTKETQQLPDGGQIRVYPRLKHGGAHLSEPALDRTADIIKRITVACIQAMAVILVLILLLAVLLKPRLGSPYTVVIADIFRGKTVLPWNWMLATFCCLAFLGALVLNLGASYHIMGTDKVGQDVFYQAVKSIRTGLVIGTLTTLVMLPFAIALGIMAGYFRGWIDDVIQYIYTTLSSIPGVLLIAAAVLMVQVYIANHADAFDSIALRQDVRLLSLCLILGVTSWTGLCRLLRGETLKLREVDYIQAAWAFGVPHGKVITRHILPNVMHIVLIAVVLDFSGLVLAEAVLSYVGVGVDPTMNSWGNMINRARLEMAREPMVWWSLLAAFMFMFVLVLAANLLSDAVRDAFDPRLRQG